MKLGEYLAKFSYPGRGIAFGRSADGTKLIMVYFIMGRSVNSRNRMFVSEGCEVRTKAVDESKMTDPSLIIYYPVRTVNGWTIVTNGDQTDTIRDHIAAGSCFRNALLERRYEPDAPNYTPRISAAAKTDDGRACYLMSVLRKSEESDRCRRFFYKFTDVDAGVGHIIHTYDGDGDPLPSFLRSPVEVEMGDTAESMAAEVWGALNEDNKVSLFVRTVGLDGESGTDTVIINKYEPEKG